MSSYRIKLGKNAEDLALNELKALGYDIIERNYRCCFGEIDILAVDGDVFVFVEVRCKTTTKYGTPAESVDLRKQRKIYAVATHYLGTHDNSYQNYRFDVVEVGAEKNKLIVTNVIKDAFVGEER